MEIASFANDDSSARKENFGCEVGFTTSFVMKIVSALCTYIVSVTNTTLFTTLVLVWNMVS